MPNAADKEKHEKGKFITDIYHDLTSPSLAKPNDGSVRLAHARLIKAIEVLKSTITAELLTDEKEVRELYEALNICLDTEEHQEDIYSTYYDALYAASLERALPLFSTAGGKRNTDKQPAH